MLVYFVAAFLLLVGLDARVTYDRVRASGPGIELNPLARWLFMKWGMWSGLLVGLGIPNAVLLFVLLWFQLSHAFAFVLGAKTLLAILQVRSLQVERYLTDFFFKE